MSHLKPIKVVAVFLFAALVVVACTATPTPEPISTPAPTPTPALTPEAPQLSKYSTTGGQVHLPAEPFIIEFDRPMDVESMLKAFQITPHIEGSLTWQSDHTIRFDPAGEGFARDTEYVVTIGTEARSEAGRQVTEPIEIRFRTAGYIAVTDVQPFDGTEEVDVDTVVALMFNGPVVPLVSLDAQAMLPQPLTLDPEVGGKGEWLNTSTYIFRPEKGLAPGTVYTARIASFQGIHGSALTTDYVWTFSTISPRVISTYPRPQSVHVSPSTVISTTFNQPMDHTSAESLFGLREFHSEEPMPGRFQWHENTMGFVPDEELALDTEYVWWLEKGALAATGTRQTATDSLGTFTTIKPPAVTSTLPFDGETDADPSGGIRIQFSSPIDRASLSGNLSIIPEPTRVYSYWVESDTKLVLSSPLEPSTTHTVTLGTGIRGRYGHPLEGPTTFSFTTAALRPMVSLRVPGRIGSYNAYTHTVVYAAHRNVSALRYSLYELDESTLMELIGENSWQIWDKFLPDEDTLLHRWTEPVSSTLNANLITPTTVAQKGGEPLDPGVYCLTITAPGMPGQRKGSPAEKHIMLVSKTNLTLKCTATDALVWATDLASGEVLAGMPIALYNEKGIVIAEGTTDEDGVFTTTYPQRDPWTSLFAFGHRLSELTLVSSQWTQGLSPWEFGLPSALYQEEYRGYLYTDRAIYRPGQMVYFKGILRRDNDAFYSIPTELAEVTVTIRDAQNKPVYEETLSLSGMGTFHGEFTLGNEASLGYYSLEVMLRREHWISTGFQVAEYRKPEFIVEVVEEQGDYVQGDDINVEVSAYYYFGGPVANAEVRWRVLSQPYFFNRWEGEGYYSFVDYDWEDRWGSPSFGELIHEGIGQTDEAGNLSFKVLADISDQKMSQVFVLEASVTDLNNQEVSNRTSVIIHKGTFYIGLEPKEYVGRTGQEQGVSVLTVDIHGEPAPSRDVQLIYYEHKWYSVREQADNGRFYWTSKVQNRPVFTESVRTGSDGYATSHFTPSKGGMYKLAAKGLDEFENAIHSATYLWVSDQRYISWRMEDNDRIELVADKDSYDPGETATILIPSPYQGEVEALLTIERGHIISHQRLTLESNSEQVEIPILPEYAPNVYISVVLVKGQDETSPHPSFKLGYVALPVSIEEKEITISVTQDRDGPYGPRDTVIYNILTTDHEGNGVPAEISLTLVDLSVLALAEPHQTDIVAYFYRERGLGVVNAATLAVSVDRYNLRTTEDAKGGGGGGPEAGVRHRFPDVAYWNPVIQTDENGRAQVSVELPDNLTTWRMQAIGVTADTLVGTGKTDIVATKKMLLRPVAPRFFVIGDRPELALVAHNNSEDDIEVEAALEGSGVTIVGGPQKVTISAKGKTKVSWLVTVEAVEQARLRFSAQGKGLSDAVELTIPVYHYSAPEIVATAGEVEDSIIEEIELPAAYDPTMGELTVKLEPSLAAGMADGLRYLQTYPYDCIEQTVSRFLPNIFTYRALRDLGIEDSELEVRTLQQVSIGLQRLYKLQHYDGGWGWWASEKSNSSITAYVLFGMTHARDAGFAVDENSMSRAARFLDKYLAGAKEVDEAGSPNRRAHILYVLAFYGQGDLGRTVGLFEQRQVLDNYGKAFLALALHEMEPEETARTDALVSDLVGASVMSATGAHWEEETVVRWAMNTDTRSTAIVLDALVKLNPANHLVPQAVRWLMANRREGHWESTQETVYALLALTDYMVTTGELKADYGYNLTINEATLAEGTVTKDNLDEPEVVEVPIAELLADERNEVHIERTIAADQSGDGKLYYSMHLRYFLPSDQVRAVNRGLIVARDYTLLDDPERPVASARVGDVIKVRLTIIAPSDLHYLVVEDPLPAGCEAVDTTLKTTSVTADRPQVTRLDEKASSWSWGWWWFAHAELRDEKVALFSTYLPRGTYEYAYLIRASVPGEFLLMPTTAYEMYFPETFGRSDGGRFIILE